MRIVAISGSLRSGSSNGAVLRAAGSVAPPGMELSFYEGLGGLPHFNPDLDYEGAEPPAPVKELRSQLRAADAVLISSPEYAHGVPGSLKNALDWIVSSGEISGKPIVLINVSAIAHLAQESLAETLTVMEGKVTSLLIPLARNRIDPQGHVSDPAVLKSLRSALDALAAAGG
jgi:NAD(P)H-dependent FMN reductase